MSGRWRRNLSDATWLFALPLVTALMPWRLGFALLRRVAAAGHGYGDAVEAAWQQARTHCPGQDETSFRRDLRLLLLLDRCDSCLVLSRGPRWWRRQIDVHGDGLDALHAGLLLNSHWGAGSWIWRLLAEGGISAHFLARRAGVGDIGHGRVSRWFLAWREWALRRAGCAGVIFTGGSRDTLRATWAAGDSVLGMLDLPAAEGRRHIDVRLLERNARFPLGLAALALESGASISLIACGIDTDSGRRQLYTEALPAGLDVDGVMRRYAAFVDRRIRDQPALWQMWPQARLYWNDAVHGDP